MQLHFLLNISLLDFILVADKKRHKGTSELQRQGCRHEQGQDSGHSGDTGRGPEGGANGSTNNRRPATGRDRGPSCAQCSSWPNHRLVFSFVDIVW